MRLIVESRRNRNTKASFSRSFSYHANGADRTSDSFVSSSTFRSLITGYRERASAALMSAHERSRAFTSRRSWRAVSDSVSRAVINQPAARKRGSAKFRFPRTPRARAPHGYGGYTRYARYSSNDPPAEPCSFLAGVLAARGQEGHTFYTGRYLSPSISGAEAVRRLPNPPLT